VISCRKKHATVHSIFGPTKKCEENHMPKGAGEQTGNPFAKKGGGEQAAKPQAKKAAKKKKR
jgi:hypothetical protein